MECRSAISSLLADVCFCIENYGLSFAQSFSDLLAQFRMHVDSGSISIRLLQCTSISSDGIEHVGLP